MKTEGELMVLPSGRVRGSHDSKKSRGRYDMRPDSKSAAYCGPQAYSEGNEAIPQKDSIRTTHRHSSRNDLFAIFDDHAKVRMSLGDDNGSSADAATNVD